MLSVGASSVARKFIMGCIQAGETSECLDIDAVMYSLYRIDRSSYAKVRMLSYMCSRIPPNALERIRIQTT